MNGTNNESRREVDRLLLRLDLVPGDDESSKRQSSRRFFGSLLAARAAARTPGEWGTERVSGDRRPHKY